MKKILFTILIFCVCSAASYAAPVVSTYDSKTKTIGGTAFGLAPDIVFFDDFESGTLNDDISLTGAVYGSYSALSATYQPYYTSDIAVSGNLAMQSNLSLATGVAAYVDLDATEIFIDWHLQLPADTNPPYGDELSINWKQMWLLGSSTIDDDLVIPTILGSSPPYIDLDYVDYYVNGNESDPGFTASLTTNMQKKLTYGSWNHWACHIKGGYQDDGVFEFWEVYSGGVNKISDLTEVNTLKVDGLWERVAINAYGRKTENCYPSFDDIYIAVGTNCKARIVVGNNATYSSSTKTAIQVADENNWDTTSIVIYAFNQGSFVNYEKCYLFVIDADGTASDGFPVYFDSEGTLQSGTPVCESCNIQTFGNVTLSGNVSFNS